MAWLASHVVLVLLAYAFSARTASSSVKKKSVPLTLPKLREELQRLQAAGAAAA